MITTYHPIDPDTEDRFAMDLDVTVNNFSFKLIDCCGCKFCYDCTRKCLKKCWYYYNCCPEKKARKMPDKPESMMDVPSSPDSDVGSDYEDPYKGLSNAAILLGEGAIMYLQIMKTITCLFALLVIINFPILYALPDFTANNDYTNFESMSSYYTLGNAA